MLLFGLFALTTLQYRVPQNYGCLLWRHNHPAKRPWQGVLLPHSLPALDARTYRVGFSGLLCLIWTACAIVFAMRHGALPFKATRAVVIGAAFALAVFAPPLLPTGSYAYAALMLSIPHPVLPTIS